MNLFEKLYTSVKDTVKKEARKALLTVQKKAYVAKLEQLIVEKEQYIDQMITESMGFEYICEHYVDLETLKEQLNLANKTYEYIFTERDKK